MPSSLRDACQDTWGFEEQIVKQIGGLMRIKGKDALQANQWTSH